MRRRNRIAACLLLGQLAWAPGGTVAAELPDMGEASALALPAAQAKRIGSEMLRQLRAQGRLLEDPLVNHYVRSLGQNLASYANDQERDYTFFVVAQGSINAFAAPGGFIGINSGLIVAAESESELASVMSHEIAHVKQRHLARAVEATGDMQLPLAAALLAAILVGGGGELTQAALAATIAGGAQAQINFTRGNEREADRLGIQLLADAGFDPFGMPAFFEKLQRSSSLYGGEVYEFLITHPVTTDRIAESRDRAERYRYSRRADNELFALVRERARVLQMENPLEAVRHFDESLAQMPNHLPLLYGKTVALLQAQQAAPALELALSLVQREPGVMAFNLALAEAYRGVQQPDRALALLNDLIDLYPSFSLLKRMQGELLLSLGEHKKANGVLLDLVREHGDDAYSFQLLAESSSRLKQKQNAHYYLAKSLYIRGDRDAALQQLAVGLKLPDTTTYQRERMLALQKVLRDEDEIAEREQAKNQRQGPRQ